MYPSIRDNGEVWRGTAPYSDYPVDRDYSVQRLYPEVTGDTLGHDYIIGDYSIKGFIL